MSFLDDFMDATIREMERKVPPETLKKLKKMAAIQAAIQRRLHGSQAIDFEMVNRFNHLCYELFPMLQDGEEFHKEEPEVTVKRKVDLDEAPPVKSIDFAGFRFTRVEGQENTVRIERLK